MTPEEEAELTERRKRAELERLRREQASREVDDVIRDRVMAMRQQRIAAGIPTRGDVVRAHAADTQEGPKLGQLVKRKAGSVPSVAFRLGLTETTFHRRRKALWGAQPPWPPTLED